MNGAQAQRKAMREARERAALEKARKERDEERAAEAAEKFSEQVAADAELIRLAGEGQGSMARESSVRQDVAESEYWFAVVFESRAQKLAVLSALGLPVSEDKYISGLDFIRALKLPVPELHRPRRRLKANLTWEEFVEE